MGINGKCNYYDRNIVVGAGNKYELGNWVTESPYLFSFNATFSATVLNYFLLA